MFLISQEFADYWNWFDLIFIIEAYESTYCVEDLLCFLFGA